MLQSPSADQPFNQAPALKQAQSLPSGCTWQLDRAYWCIMGARNCCRMHSELIRSLPLGKRGGQSRCTNVAGDS